MSSEIVLLSAGKPVSESPAADWAELAEQRLLDAAILSAPELGWSRPMLSQAAARTRLSPGEIVLLTPNGPSDLVALLSRRHDEAALAALAEVDASNLKMRERIRQAVQARLDAAEVDAPAVRRWAGYLALPPNLPLALRLTWESADRLWIWAGDAATDENHYSKRAILSTILVGGLLLRLHTGREAADAYVDARIDNVMTFETWKAKLRPVDLARELAGALGRLRYGRP